MQKGRLKYKMLQNQSQSQIEEGLNFSQARSVLLKQSEHIEFVQVGAGGTGSWCTPHLVRLARELIGQGRKVTLTIVDPDTVSAANTVRQNFAMCEVGQSKAKTLALRYGTAWGLEIGAIAQPFDAGWLRRGRSDRLVIVVACVDNAAARQAIARVLDNNPKYVLHSGRPQLPDFWVCDAGNYSDGGQILLGSASTGEAVKGAFSDHTPGVCLALPSPYLQHPELLEPRPEELPDHQLSCAELLVANAQSLTINVMVAAGVADMLTRLLWGSLKRFATYLYLPTGTMRSRYITTAALQVFWDKGEDAAKKEWSRSVA